MIILAEIVYSKPGSDFGSLDNESLKRSPAKKSARDMSLTELFHAKDSLKAVALAPKDPFLLGLRNENRERSRIKFLIVKKISLPFGFIIFYFLGVFLGTSFYKIHVVVPLLIGYLILFPSWYYLQIIFERLYKEELVGSFLGANGGTLIFAFIVCSWFLILRKYGLLKKKPEETELLVSTEEKS